MLELEHVTVTYGAITAVDDVSLTVDAGSVVALLGANGAGKSSLLKGICGSAELRHGSIRLAGRPLRSGRRPFRAARRGIAHVPEGRRMIAPLTVEENLELAAFTTGGDAAAIRAVYEVFPRLADRRSQVSGSLSGGEQQMLAIGRALCSRPKVVLMDEPSMGLAPIMVQEIYRLFSERHELTDGVTFLLAEQSAALALGVADQVHLLAGGRIVRSGSPQEIQDDAPALLDSYLGGRAG